MGRNVGKELFGAIDSYMAQDSMFRDERDVNAVMYDTLGNAIGAEDISIANRPGLAIWNSVSGIRIVPGQELSPLEEELMRVASQIDGWPLSNRESMDGMRLGAGAQSDLTNLAKNEVTLRQYNNMDFQNALLREISRPTYIRMSDKDKALTLRRIEDAYYERAFQILLQMPEYGNLATAYQDRQREMTVSSSTNKASYNGNGSTTVFAYNYKIFDQDDLTVIIRSATGTETVKTITTDYTVSGVGNDGGGNVTMGTAPASGETITILREQDLVQELDLVPNDPFPANLMEDALDRLTFMVQQHDEELARSIKASKTNTITSTEFTVLAADRANKIFAFDSSGELAVTQELGTYRGNWATSTAFAQRDIVKDTSNNNIYICLVAHTSTGAQPITSNADVAKWALLVDAASATTSASAAASSASAAATSATNAANSASAASTSAGNAATSESNASTSASAAATSATNASNSATAAAGLGHYSIERSQPAAQTAAEAAQTAAETAQTAAETAETNAETAETNAAASASAASTSETNAASSASAASTSASNAATSATNASNSASAAATSASNASTSETNAANSASAASGSATSAANSAAAAAASFDSFDDRYLGVKASDPTLDNDGNALVCWRAVFLFVRKHHEGV
jgi:hypothetical protein